MTSLCNVEKGRGKEQESKKADSTVSMESLIKELAEKRAALKSAEEKGG